ncbi:MAG: hypothetical protein DRI90_26935, partial [Deltaproteobacteria bacterium]
MKRRGSYNIAIDALLLVVMMAIVGVGLLVKYVLLPGKDLAIVGGRRVWLTFLGWDRHDWGEVHFILGLVFAGLLVLHIVLHWKTILCLLRGLVPHRAWRSVATVGVGLASVAAVSFPLFVQSETADRAHHQGHEAGRGMGGRYWRNAAAERDDHACVGDHRHGSEGGWRDGRGRR